MKIHMIDSIGLYRRIIAAADPLEKQTHFIEGLLLPFAGMFQRFGVSLTADSQDKVMEMVGSWRLHTPATLDAAALDALRLLDEADAQARTEAALKHAAEAFAPYADQIRLDQITAALMLSQPAADLPGNMRGYAGFGGVPGYIMPTFSEPNAYNLARVEPIAAHEFHHNIMFSLVPFNPMTVTVGEYIIYEGLAESFATSLYGDDLVGFFVEDVAPADLEIAREKIGAALDVNGFDKVRGYIFGDGGETLWGYEAVGVPPFGGYAVGYQVVQAYLRATGKSAVEATFTPARAIIAESGYFERVG